MDWIIKNNKLIVSGFHPGSAGREKGVKPGDILRKVNDVDVLKMGKDASVSHASTCLPAFCFRSQLCLTCGAFSNSSLTRCSLAGRGRTWPSRSCSALRDRKSRSRSFASKGHGPAKSPRAPRFLSTPQLSRACTCRVRSRRKSSRGPLSSKGRCSSRTAAAACREARGSDRWAQLQAHSSSERQAGFARGSVSEMSKSNAGLEGTREEEEGNTLRLNLGREY